MTRGGALCLVAKIRQPIDVRTSKPARMAAEPWCEVSAAGGHCVVLRVCDDDEEYYSAMNIPRFACIGPTFCPRPCWPLLACHHMV